MKKFIPLFICLMLCFSSCFTANAADTSNSSTASYDLEKGDKQMFVCKTCGYRQHMNAFKKERENKNKLARKSDVKKYMNQQKQQQTAVEDSPFAALLKLKDELK